MTTKTKIRQRDPDSFGRAHTATLQKELRALVAERHAALDAATTEGTEAVLAMLLELVSVRRLLGEQVGQRLGLSRQAITLRIKPYREKLGIPRTPVVEPWWPRPYAKVETAALLDELAAKYDIVREPAAAPDVRAIDERIRPYVTELTNRALTPAIKGRGRWSGKTSLAAIATDAGIGRSTLARIMGWDT